MYRSDKYINYIKKQISCAPAKASINTVLKHCRLGGQIVPAHQRMGCSGGTAIKPPDTYALPLDSLEHADEHCGDKTFWGNTDRAKLCVEHVCRYLDQNHNIDGWRKALELITDYMEENKL